MNTIVYAGVVGLDYTKIAIIKANKEKSTEKIDGAVATIIGLDRAIRCGVNTGASVYEYNLSCIGQK